MYVVYKELQGALLSAGFEYVHTPTSFFVCLANAWRQACDADVE